jgi:hypothetical protein
MKYITIDGDDVGQRITSAYLTNDLITLSKVNDLVNHKTFLIAEFLVECGFTIIFRAADGVAGYYENDDVDENFIYAAIKRIANNEMTFSAGIGSDLRESYIALLFAKSSGKARLQNFESHLKNV